MNFATRSMIIAGLVAAFAAPAAARGPTKKQKKVNVYVEIINKWSSYVSKTRTNYSKWVDMKKGPTCKERGIRGPGGIGDSAKATFAGYKKALKKGPKLAADAGARKMVAALIKMHAPINEASKYYHKHKYKDDDCKRGKELHIVLVALFAEFAEGDRVVRSFVTEYNDQRALKDLAKTKKKYGKRFRYYHEKIIVDGKALVRIVDSQMQQEQPDLAEIKTSLAGFSASLDAVERQLKKAKKKAASVLYQGGYKQFVKNGTWFKEAIVDLLRVVEKPDKRRQSKNAVSRSLKQVFKAYNNMVDASNKVMLSKKIK